MLTSPLVNVRAAVLRELEGLSCQELTDVLEVPIGTVMSGLSRARQAFRRGLHSRPKGSEHPMERVCS